MTARLVAGVGLRPRTKGCAIVGAKRAAHLPCGLDLRVAELAGQPEDRIAARLGAREQEVTASLARLRFVGAVTDAPAADGPPRMVRFFERTLGAEQAATALGRLATATVRVTGHDELMTAVTAQLRACGVDVVTTEDGPADLVIGAVAGDTPSLLMAATADGVVVGPLCSVTGGRCPHCVELPAATAGAGPDVVTSRVAVALAVGEAVRHLSGTGHCRTSGGTITVRGVDQSFQPLPRAPHCIHCGLADAHADEYRWLQAVDVPLKQNWAHPILPVMAHRVDGTITVLPRPDGRTDGTRRQVWSGVLGVAVDVFAPRGSRMVPVPSVGGTQLLNTFVCGTVDDTPVAYYLDRVSGTAVPVLAPPSVPSAGPLVVVAVPISKAEKAFGRKAELTIHQDTGFAVAELRRALARKGFGAVLRDGDTLEPELLTELGLDLGRDVVTAVLEIVPDARTRRVAPRQTTGVDMLTELLTGTEVPGYVRCHGVDGIAEGLHPIGTWLTPTAIPTHRLDAALRLRGMAPDALAVFGMDLARWQPIGPAVRAQAEAAYRVHRAACERGQPSLLLSDLPSTALDPDGRGWRTTWRSFAAVALGGDLPAPDLRAVTW